MRTVRKCQHQPCSGTIFLMHRRGMKESSYAERAVEPVVWNSLLFEIEASREEAVKLIKTERR